jgi:hypothetical protein
MYVLRLVEYIIEENKKKEIARLWKMFLNKTNGFSNIFLTMPPNMQNTHRNRNSMLNMIIVYPVGSCWYDTISISNAPSLIKKNMLK